MRIGCLVIVLASLSLLGADQPQPQHWNFEDAELGKLPGGWSIAKTGRWPGSVWAVREDESAPSGAKVLAQTSPEGPNRLFNLCVVEKASYTDVDLTVSLKAVKGRLDQGGGPVWRYQDENNYYIARVNPLEKNFRVYKVVDGRRRQLGSSDVAAPAGKWHTIRIVHQGDHIRCYLNGRLHLDVKDGTFKQAGKVGLWTKADAVTAFDTLAVRSPPGQEPASPGKVVLVWESRQTPVPPNVDGVVEQTWRTAKPLKVIVREAIGGHNPKLVILRALHTDKAIYVLAQWPDATRSDMRDPFVWNTDRQIYQRRSKPDDQFAIEFPMGGEFDVSMLALARDYVADVWHWKAGRGNPVGWVDDKRHIIGRNPSPGSREYSMGGHGKVFISRLMDAGTPSYVLKPLPTTFQGQVVDSFAPCQPTESLADVRGKGVHDGRTWTLEIVRKLDTGHHDDAVLNPQRDNPCAIAVLDDELYWHHSVSPLIILRFSQPRRGNER